MPTYDYPDDGKYHTRYSEVIKAQTANGARRVVMERLGLKDKVNTKATDFGTTRHDMWEHEAAETGKSPECFNKHLKKQWGVYETEQHRATELFENIVIHFTTDLIGTDEHSAISEAEDGTRKVTGASVIDYKTGTGNRPEHYRKLYQGQKQLPTYALLLRPHGIIVKDGHYLIECWDRERKNLEAYLYVHKPIGLKEMADAKNMLKNGIAKMMAAEQLVRKEFGLEK